MGKKEKIVLSITICIYLLAFVDFKQFEFVYGVILGINNVVLIVTYGLVGFSILKLPSNYTYLSIYAGISFALSIIASIFGFYAHKEGAYLIFLPIPNLLLLFGLIVVFLKARVTKQDVSFLNLLFLRSFVVALVTSFFVYLPISSKVYRKTIIALHNGNVPLIYNLKANDYIWDFENYYKKNEVDRAVEAAEIGVEYALKWINQDHQKFFTEYKMKAQVLLLEDYRSNSIREDFEWLSNDEDYYKMKGAIEKLVDALLAKAEYEMESYNNEEAISFLNRTFVLSEILRDESVGWNRHMISIYWKLGTSFMRLNELENAEYFYTLTSELIAKTETEKQFYIGDFLMSLADLANKYKDYESAIYSLNEALTYFEVDKQNENYKLQKALTYYELAQAHMLSDEIEEASHNLDLGLKLYDNKQHDVQIGHTFPRMIVIEAVLKFLKQDYYGCKKLMEDNFEIIQEGTNQYLTYNMLFHFYIAQCNYVLSDYEASEKSLIKALEYATEAKSNKSEIMLLSANLKFTMGDYERAGELFQEVSQLYEQTNNDSGFVGLYMYLANFHVKLSDYARAEEYLNESTNMAEEEGYIMTARNLEFYNMMAYVNYYLGNYQKSDSIYSEVIRYNELKGEPNSISSGSAMNGLGLVKMDTRKHEEAELLFKKSIESYKLNFEGQHAHLGSVYLNYATLLIKMNQLDRASQLLSDSNAVFSAFYKPTHDHFGDLYYAYGLLYEKKNEAILAKQYYQKALKIYVDAFGEDNLKVKLIKQKLL